MTITIKNGSPAPNWVMNQHPTQSLRDWSAESAYLKPTHSPGIGFMSQSAHPTPFPIQAGPAHIFETMS